MVDVPFRCWCPQSLKPVAVRKKLDERSLCLKLLWRLADSQQSFRNCQKKSKQGSYHLLLYYAEAKGLLLKAAIPGLGKSSSA